MKKKIYITGIGTDVGKTIVASIITESLEADYWKPIQAGDLSYGDADKVRDLIVNKKSIIHPNRYALNTPMSPHASAAIDNIEINIKNLILPKSNNHLVIEGAGGILVPLNDAETILDTIKKNWIVIVVARHYLGSINHTLMTLKILKDKGCQVRLIFSGNENPTTESIIVKMSGVEVIGRIDEEPYFDQNVISEYANKWNNKLEKL